MANLNLNKVILGGRLVADPDLNSVTVSGQLVAVCKFALAVNRRYKNANGEYDADFINCTAWRQTGDFVGKNFRKGDSLAVVGVIQTRKWTDKDGNNRYATEVVADEACFVDSKADREAAHGAAPAEPKPTAKPAKQSPAAPAPEYRQQDIGVAFGQARAPEAPTERRIGPPDIKDDDLPF